ncbi:MAG: ThuA domain-containing protein [Verrucomicrobiota bacterium]
MARISTLAFVWSVYFLVWPALGQERVQESIQEEGDGVIRALLVAGGTIYDYAVQAQIISAGISERVAERIVWEIHLEGEGKSDEKIPTFSGPEWAMEHDIILHHYHFPRVTSSEFVENVLSPHREGKPALVIHAALHSFPIEGPAWFEFCGVKTSKVSPYRSIDVQWSDPAHPIVNSLTPWKIQREELFEIESLRPSATSVAEVVGENDSAIHPVAWVHRFGEKEARVFGTSLRTSIPMMDEPEYFDLLARGFLWALGKDLETSFVEVAREEHLSEVEFPESVQQLHPGANLAIGAETSVTSLPSYPEIDMSRVVDGDITTSWGPEGTGPFLLELTLPKLCNVEVVAVLPTYENLPPYRLEGRTGDGSWEELGGHSRGGVDSDWQIYHFANRRFDGFRLSFDERFPPAPLAIREIAAWSSLEQVPESFGLNGSSETISSGTEGALSSRDRASGLSRWEIATAREFPRQNQVSSLVGLAGGGVLALIDEVENGKMEIRSLELSNQEIIVADPSFAESLPQGSAICGDGEWIYLISPQEQQHPENSTPFSFSRMRDTNRDGASDERYFVGEIHFEGQSLDVGSISAEELVMGADSGFYVRLGNREEGNWWRFDQELTARPVHPVTQSRWRVFRTSPGQLPGDGEGYWKHTQASSQWVGRAPGGSPESRLDFPPVASHAHDGHGALWVASEAVGPEGGQMLYLASKGPPSRPAFLWDEIPDRDLFTYFNDETRLIRFEAPFELARRKRGSQILRRWMDEKEGPLTRQVLGMLRAKAIQRTGLGIESWIDAAHSESPEVRAFAFQRLATMDGTQDLPVYSMIQDERAPLVSASILEAVAGTDTVVPGLNELALEFVADSSPRLAEVAAAFLGEAAGIEWCFNLIEDVEQRARWDPAFEALGHLQTQEVVDGLILLAENAGDFHRRNLAKRTLLRHYFLSDGTRWGGSSVIDGWLAELIEDPRVDFQNLLDLKDSFRVRPVVSEALVDRARRDLPIEVEVVRLLDGQDLPAGAKNWLLEITEDESRDSDFRMRSLTLLAAVPESDLSRKVWAQFEALPWSEIGRETQERFREVWLGNPVHKEQIAWLDAKKSRASGHAQSLLKATVDRAKEGEVDP